MNDTIITILKRRSYRAYKKDTIKQEELDLILNAGLYAPSATNSQNWHFTVIKNNKILDEISTKTKEIMKSLDNEYFKKMAINPNYHVFHNAPLVILVSGPDEKFTSDNLAVASQNIMLAAESLDIGSCWIGLVEYFFNTKEGIDYTSKLNLPANYRVHHAIILGYKIKTIEKALPREKGSINYIN